MRAGVRGGWLVSMAISLGVLASQVHAQQMPRPFLSADVDGDGKKDPFYQIYFPDGRVELGVKLSKYKSRYVKISDDDDIKSMKKAYLYVEDRTKFLEQIRVPCEQSEGCPGYRKEAISVVSKSKSPQVVLVVFEFSGKALLMDDKGRMTETWYRD